MSKIMKTIALLLVLVLTVSCLPLGAVTAFAAETDETHPPTEEPGDTTVVDAEQSTESVAETDPVENAPPVMMFSASPADNDDDSEGGSSGSETGDGGDGSGNAAGDGSNYMIAVGITMEVVYYRYDQCYNRFNSHGSVELCERMADGTVKVLETGDTNAEGNLSFTRKIVYTDGVCNKSTYFIREKVAPAGYVLDTKEYPVSCTENIQVMRSLVLSATILYFG